jgi:hypothetical protein
MSWQDRLFGIFLFAAAVTLITLGMTIVGSDGVLILLGSMCFYFATIIYRINRDTDLEEDSVISSADQQAVAENLLKQRSEDKQRDLAQTLINKKTEDKHNGLMSDLMGKS